MADLLGTDEFLVNRNDVTYTQQQETLMASLQDTDHLLINRAGQTYKITGSDLINSVIDPLEVTVILAPDTGYTQTEVTAVPVVSGGKQPDDGFIFIYQWVTADDAAGTNKANIAGATDASFTPENAQVGKFLGCVVGTTDALGTNAEGEAYIGPIQVLAQAPVIADVVISEIYDGQNRFTDKEFPYITTMAVDGEPAPTYEVKAKLSGTTFDFSVKSDVITDVEPGDIITCETDLIESVDDLTAQPNVILSFPTNNEFNCFKAGDVVQGFDAEDLNYYNILAGPNENHGNEQRIDATTLNVAETVEYGVRPTNTDRARQLVWDFINPVSKVTIVKYSTGSATGFLYGSETGLANSWVLEATGPVSDTDEITSTNNKYRYYMFHKDSGDMDPSNFGIPDSILDQAVHIVSTDADAIPPTITVDGGDWIGTDNSVSGDAFPGWNQSEVWSNGVTSQSGTYKSGKEADKLFDGDLASRVSDGNNGGSVTWTPATPITFTDKVEVLTPSGRTVSYNGETANPNPSSSEFFTIASGGGTLTSIAVFPPDSGSQSNWIAVRIDGKLLVDTGIEGGDPYGDTSLVIDTHYSNKLTVASSENLELLAAMADKSVFMTDASSVLVTQTPYKLVTTDIESVSQDSTWNQSSIWSNGVDQADKSLAQQAFNGVVDVSQPMNYTNPATISFLGLSGLSKLEVFLYVINDSNNNTLEINGTSIPTQTTANSGVWHDFSNLLQNGSLNTIKDTTSGSASIRLCAVQCDGKLLVDQGIAGAPTNPVLTFADPNPDLQYFLPGDVVQTTTQVGGEISAAHPLKMYLKRPNGTIANARVYGLKINGEELIEVGDEYSRYCTHSLGEPWDAGGEPHEAFDGDPTSFCNGPEGMVIFAPEPPITNVKTIETYYISKLTGYQIGFEFDGYEGETEPFSETNSWYPVSFAGDEEHKVISTGYPDSNTMVVDGGEWLGSDGSGTADADTVVEYQTNGGEGTVIEVNTTDNTLLVTNSGDRDNRWIAENYGEGSGTSTDFYVAPVSAIPIQQDHAWGTLQIINDKAQVTGIQKDDPGFTAVTAKDYSIKFPAQFPTGNEPDSDIPRGACIAAIVAAENSEGRSVKESNCFMPLDVNPENAAGPITDSTPTTLTVASNSNLNEFSPGDELVMVEADNEISNYTMQTSTIESVSGSAPTVTLSFADPNPDLKFFRPGDVVQVGGVKMWVGNSVAVANSKTGEDYRFPTAGLQGGSELITLEEFLGCTFGCPRPVSDLDAGTVLPGSWGYIRHWGFNDLDGATAVARGSTNLDYGAQRTGDEWLAAIITGYPYFGLSYINGNPPPGADGADVDEIEVSTAPGSVKVISTDLVNNTMVVDGGDWDTSNQNEVWSDIASASNLDSSHPISNAFDGNDATWTRTNAIESFLTITFDPPISFTSKVEYLGYVNYAETACEFTVDGVTQNNDSGIDINAGLIDPQDIGSSTYSTYTGSGSLSQIKAGRCQNARTYFSQLRIDGKLLVDTGTGFFGDSEVTYGPVTGTGTFQSADLNANTITLSVSNDRWIDTSNRLGTEFYARPNLTVLNADNPKHVALQQAIADAFDAFPQKVNERRTAIASSFYRLMEGETLSAAEFALLEETVIGAVNATEPFALDGYYPLYYTPDKADAASSVGEHHVHNINGVNYFMPDGGTLYHGNYIAPETSTTDNNDSSY